jgi:ribosomal protein S18 acetylase RimI-like enzyme
VSVNVDSRVVDPGETAYVEQAWQLKEAIRREHDVLRQRRGFFESAYKRSTVFLFVDRTNRDALIGFAVVRRDGYILFLAVADEYQGEGFGEALVARVAGDFGSVTCHARTTNTDAIEFYQHIGFTVERRIEDYYEDGGDAYYLRLGEEDGITDRLTKLFSGR